MSALATMRLENPARGKRKAPLARARGKKNVGELLIFGNPKKGFGNHRRGCACTFCKRAAKLQSGELKPPKLPNRKRNSKRIRGARLNAKAFAGWKHFTAKEKNFLRSIHMPAPRNDEEVRAYKETLRKIDEINARYKNPTEAEAKARETLERWLSGMHRGGHTASKKDMGEVYKQALRHYSGKNPKRVTRGRRRADRRNPSETKQAVRLFQGFHGHDPKEIAEQHISAAVRLDYTALGDLKYLVVETPLGKQATFTFEDDRVKLASSPDGKQLYCIGGDQNILPLLDERSREKDFIDLGDALEVAYLARKVHGDFRPIEYFHEFGEVNGALPRLMFDKVRKQLFFIGGDYFIDVTMRAPGTPLGKVSPGIEN